MCIYMYLSSFNIHVMQAELADALVSKSCSVILKLDFKLFRTI